MKTLLEALFFLLLVSQICFAQWVQLGLEDKAIKEVAARNSNLFAITYDNVLYRSTNNGIDWTQIVESEAVDIAIAPSGTVFMVKDFPSQYTAILLSSSNYGDVWDTLNVWEQLPPNPSCSMSSMNLLVSNEGFIYCGLYLSCFEKAGCTALVSSTDDGITWTTPGWNILGGHLFDFKGESVISAGFWWGLDAPRSGDDHLYMSTDDGSSWTELGNPPLFVGGCHVLSLCLNGNILLGGSDNSSGLFLSTDSCTTWAQVSSMNIQAGLSIESGGTLVGTDNLGVFLFNNNGDSLGSRNDGLTNFNIHTITIDNNDFVYTGTDNGVWRRPLSEIVTSVGNESTQPSDFILSQNYPNPFNPSTKIKYSIPQTSQVQIKVYDVLGNEIETLVNEEKPVGMYELMWNATNLPSGVYFYQLRAESIVETKKMLLLK